MHNKKVHMLAFLLLVVGGLNWGLVGLLNFDLVAWIFTDILGLDILTRVVFILVGLAAVLELISHKGRCKECTAGGGGAAPSAPAPDAGPSNI